jgi:hypothetical protein
VEDAVTGIVDEARVIDLMTLHEQSLAVAFAEWQAAVDHGFMWGNDALTLLGLRSVVPARGPSPIERALAILEPELRRCPLYDAGAAWPYAEPVKLLPWKEGR